MKEDKKRKVRGQGGFTLIELVLVIAVLGIVISLMVTNLGGGADVSARGLRVIDADSKIRNSWALFGVGTGVPRSDMTGSNPGIANSNNAMDMIVCGRDYVATAYQDDYDRAGIRQMSEIMKIVTAPTASSSGSYTCEGYPVTASADSNNITVQFQKVPSEVVEYVYNKRTSSTFNAATAVTTGTVQYSAVSGGSHTLTLVHPH